ASERPPPSRIRPWITPTSQAIPATPPPPRTSALLMPTSAVEQCSVSQPRRPLGPRTVLLAFYAVTGGNGPTGAAAWEMGDSAARRRGQRNGRFHAMGEAASNGGRP